MIDFLCFENGDICNKKIVKLYLPKNCCGNKTIISNKLFNGANQLDSYCKDHMSIYPKVWANFGHTQNIKTILDIAEQKSNGCTCISCGMHNQYAEPNVGDKYKCFECRN